MSLKQQSLKTFLPAAALLALLVVPAAAQNAANEVQKACQNDIKTLCSGVKPGGGRIRDCIMGKTDQLSPSCKTALSAAMSGAGAPKN